MVRHFLSLNDFSKQELNAILALAVSLRQSYQQGGIDAVPPLYQQKGRNMAMIFQSPSTRTRVSFDIAMRQLGGGTILLSPEDMQLGRGETIADTARVLSRYVDAIMIRILDHEALYELASHASVSVINGLTRYEHPCQILADVMTYQDYRGNVEGSVWSWFGPYNNVTRSLMHAARILGFELRIACPHNMAPSPEEIDAERQKGGNIHITQNADEAAFGADCFVTDVWLSMGDEDNPALSKQLLPYQINEALMAKAKQSALFMHCLPAHREKEVTSGVIDGAQSVVFDEAENRLHAQKAILAWLLKNEA